MNTRYPTDLTNDRNFSFLALGEHDCQSTTHTNIGRWLEAEVRFLENYERAFNQKPPEPAALALLNASDHTRRVTGTDVDWIEIFKQKQNHVGGVMKRKSSLMWVMALSVQLILITAAFYPTATGAAEAIERIGVTDARMQVKEKTALLVCSYDDDRCKNILLEGAILQSEFEARLSTLAKTQSIIFYCA